MEKIFIALDESELRDSPISAISEILSDHITVHENLTGIVKLEQDRHEAELEQNSRSEKESSESTIFEVIVRPVQKMTVKRSFYTKIEELNDPIPDKTKKR